MRLVLAAVTLFMLAAPTTIQACEWGKGQTVQAPAPTTTVVQAPQTPIPTPDGSEG
jgi:hypothetical protein